jgi:hypothetical protein
MKVRLWAATGAATLVAGGLLTAGLGSATASSGSQQGWRTAAGGSASAAVSSDISTAKTIQIVAHQDAFRLVNVNSKNFGPGDYFVFEETLHNRATGRVIGHDSVQCTANFTTFRCEGTFFITGRGNVEIAGATTQYGKQLYAVTGGTENFQNVRGQLRVGGGSGDNTNLTLELLP